MYVQELSAVRAAVGRCNLRDFRPLPMPTSLPTKLEMNELLPEPVTPMTARTMSLLLQLGVSGGDGPVDRMQSLTEEHRASARY